MLWRATVAEVRRAAQAEPTGAVVHHLAALGYDEPATDLLAGVASHFEPGHGPMRGCVVPDSRPDADPLDNIREVAWHLAEAWNGPGVRCDTCDPAQNDRLCRLCLRVAPPQNPERPGTSMWTVCVECISEGTSSDQPQMPAHQSDRRGAHPRGHNVPRMLAGAMVGDTGQRWDGCWDCGELVACNDACPGDESCLVCEGNGCLDREAATLCQACNTARRAAATRWMSPQAALEVERRWMWPRGSKCTSCSTPFEPVGTETTCRVCSVRTRAPCWCGQCASEGESGGWKHRVVTLLNAGTVPARIAAALGESVQAVMAAAASVAPWRPWEAFALEEQMSAAEIERVRPSPPCCWCGTPVPGRRTTCSRACADARRETVRLRNFQIDSAEEFVDSLAYQHAADAWIRRLPVLRTFPCAALVHLAGAHPHDSR